MTCAGAGGSLRRGGGLVIRFGGEARAAPPAGSPRSPGDEIDGGGVGRSAGVWLASGTAAGRGGAATGRGATELCGDGFSAFSAAEAARSSAAIASGPSTGA